MALKKDLVVVMPYIQLEKLLNISVWRFNGECLFIRFVESIDKMNHYAMYIKLMNRLIPVQVLKVLENWFSLCLSCVKWGFVKSYFYELETGVRQGGVLSPFLFGIFIDDLVKFVNKANVGCKMGTSCAAIFLYADDVILLAPSVHVLQLLVNIL